MLRDSAAAHPLRFAALRYFNVAGADPAGRTGQSTVGATHIVKIVCEHLAGKRDSVAIFGSDYPTADGTAVRDYIHVSDLASAHLLALEHLAGGGDSFVANCGYGHGFSVRQVIDAAERVTGLTVNAKLAPRRAGDPPALVADCRKIVDKLGWKPLLDDLETIIAHAFAWEKKLSH
jgi:UDP-glucose 4-epimerase